MSSEFAYIAVDPKGRERSGTLKATDSAAARATLEKKKLLPVELKAVPKSAAKKSPDQWSFGERVPKLSMKQRLLFTRQLATLVRVSPLEEALRTVARQSEKEEQRQIITNVADRIVEGRRLADAMAGEPQSFDPLYRALVAAGEQSGTLDVQLERLATLLERQAETRGKLISALAYPAVLTLVAVGVVAALMIAVVPKVVEQFEDVGQQLPLLTRAVIAISDVMATYWWALFLLLAGLSGGLLIALRSEGFRLKFDRMLLRIPLFGRLQRDLAAARMARTLASMVEARLPLVEGLKLTAPTIGNRALRRAVVQMESDIREGSSLSGAMKKSDLFPPLLLHIAASGERAGELGPMLGQAADMMEREFDQFTAGMLALLEPLIIIVMGAVVAAIVLAILLPILQLQSLIGA